MTCNRIPASEAMIDWEHDSDYVAARQEMAEEYALAMALIAARKHAGMTQKQVATAMGTFQAAIARLESGRTSPSTKTLRKFAEATNSTLRISFAPNPIPEPKGSPYMSADPRNPKSFMTYLASRRRLLGAAAGASTGAALLTRAAAQESTPAASPVSDAPANGIQADGTWVFTDDRGVTVTLPKAPERILADLQAAAALWDFGVRPAAVSAGTTPPDSPAWGNVDPSTNNVTSDGDELDIEKLVALNPDIFIKLTWQPDDPDIAWGIGFEDMEGYNRVNDVVPIVAISATGFADVSTQRFAELASFLGADPEAPDLIAAKDAFDAALDAFITIVDERSNLTALYAYVSSDVEWYAAAPEKWADLAFYQRVGLGLAPVVPDESGYWDPLSREQALKYPADIFFNSIRDGMLTPEELQADPVFGQHPAIKAGQIGAWNQDFIMSYQGLTLVLNDLTTLLAESVKLV